MLPFGAALLCAAAVGLAGRAVPRWLAGAALGIGLGALVNGSAIGTEAAWGFLLSLAWVGAGGVTLALRRAEVTPASEAVPA